MKKTIETILTFSIVLIGLATPCFAREAQKCDLTKPATTPTYFFEVNKTDGTVFDKTTKLTWKICTEGQSYADGHCAGKISEYTWDEAMHRFGDKGAGWRIPNIDELKSLVEGQCYNSTMNETVFPDAPLRYVWSSSSDVKDSSSAWYVNFYNGSPYSSSKSFFRKYYVKLVRGETVNESTTLVKFRSDWIAEEELRLAKIEAEEVLTLANAELNAVITCRDKPSCDKTFALAQIFVNSRASQKIQIATDTIVETYNPTEDGSVGMNITKIPGKGTSSLIRLTVTCKADNNGAFNRLCRSTKTEIYNNFRPFITKMLTD